VLGFVSAKRVFMWPQAKAKPCGLNKKYLLSGIAGCFLLYHPFLVLVYFPPNFGAKVQLLFQMAKDTIFNLREYAPG